MRLFVLVSCFSGLFGGGSSVATWPMPPLPAEATAALHCRRHQDCRPATCCHPTACVAAAAAPNCREVMCTQDCRPGTLDCGGRCACVHGSCTAILAD